LNNSRDYFFAFLNHAIFDKGVSGEGPILPPFVPESDLGLALVFALAAKFLALSVVFLAAVWVAAFALDAVAFAFAGALFAAAFAFAGAFFAAAFALAGAALAAFFAAAAVFFVAVDALSSFLAAAATFFANAACIPAFTNLAAPAVATFETVSNLASTNFFAVAAPTPGIAVNLLAFDSFALEPMVSPDVADDK
jgi:hypothetical protein